MREQILCGLMRRVCVLLAALIGVSAAMAQEGPGQALQFYPFQFAAHYGATGLPAGDAARTMEMWLAFNSCGSIWGSIPGGYGNDTPRGSFQIDVCMFGTVFGPGDRFWLMTWGAFPDEYWDTGVVHTPYADSSWHHLAVSYADSTAVLYLDGEEVAMTTGLPLDTDPYKVLLGEEIDQGPSANNNHWFAGRLDEFRLWDRALTAREVREGMHRRLDPESDAGLAGYFPFDTDSLFAIDATTNGNDLGFGAVFELPDPSDPGRIPSTVPLGDGRSASGTVSADGTLNLAKAGVEAAFTGVSAPIEFVATRIAADPVGVAATDSLPDGATTASSYWVLRRYGDGTFGRVDLRLRPTDDYFVPEDGERPERIVLLHRPFNGDAGWLRVATAAMVDVVEQTASFSGLTTDGQYLVARLEALPVAAAPDAAPPERAVLEAPYPNPSRRSVLVRYALPRAADVRLSVFDLLGRRVALLVDGSQPSGRHTVRFDGGGLASGVYLLRFEAGSVVETRPLRLLR